MSFELREVECKELVRELTPLFKKYGLEPISAHPQAVTHDCVIDFKNTELKDLVDCEFLCESATETRREFSRCMKECQQNVDLATRGSVVVNPRNHSVISATLPVDCERVFVRDEYDQVDEEETSKRMEKLASDLESIGCSIPARVGDWIHQHEFVREYLGSFEPEEETPAICYLHPKRRDMSGCRLDQLLERIY